MNVSRFQKLLEPITDLVSAEKMDTALAEKLNLSFPESGELFNAVERACHDAIAAGWMCTQGGEGRRFGRIIEPCEATGMLSIDVVDLTNIVGPHHRHPSGEVCMVMPITEGAQFNGEGRGWSLFEPGSDHSPTVTGGEALVLYMLPAGKIEFT